jgi:hypothetical protein
MVSHSFFLLKMEHAGREEGETKALAHIQGHRCHHYEILETQCCEDKVETD